MSRKVLIISPNFPPINLPDHQRIRTSLPYFQEFGWEPIVLALSADVRPNLVYGLQDSLLEQVVPKNISITYTGAMSLKGVKGLGDGSIALRCLPYLYKAGSKIIAEQKINLVYFSTTMFPVMALGPGWKKKYGVPYVLDFQDPWRNDYYNRPNAPVPPGGRFKYAVSQSLAWILEPYSLSELGHVISVSQAYPKMLLERYDWLCESQFTVLPFGAPEKDFEYLRSLNVNQKIFDVNDGNLHWVYVGIAGEHMLKALKILFLSLRNNRAREPEKWKHIKLHFVGTNYAANRNVKVVETLAYELGVDDLVEEYPERITYFEALKVLVDSDAILIIGSDDPGYTASKIYPCVLARKPILAIFHEQSSVVEVIRKCNSGQVITFASNDSPENLSEKMSLQLEWLLSLPKGHVPETDWVNFKPYTAREMTRQQCKVFNRVVAMF